MQKREWIAGSETECGNCGGVVVVEIWFQSLGRLDCFSGVGEVALFGPVAPEAVDLLEPGEDGVRGVFLGDFHFELGSCVGLNEDFEDGEFDGGLRFGGLGIDGFVGRGRVAKEFVRGS